MLPRNPQQAPATTTPIGIDPIPHQCQPHIILSRMLGRPGNERFPGSLGVQRRRRGLVEVANTTDQQNTTNQPTPQKVVVLPGCKQQQSFIQRWDSQCALSDLEKQSIHAIQRAASKKPLPASITLRSQKTLNSQATPPSSTRSNSPASSLRRLIHSGKPPPDLGPAEQQTPIASIDRFNDWFAAIASQIEADSESVYLNHLSTTATLSLIILFSSLINALPSGIPTGNYITHSASYQGSYPSYYYGQQLAPYGYGQYLAPAYYSSGQGAVILARSGRALGLPDDFVTSENSPPVRFGAAALSPSGRHTNGLFPNPLSAS
ncbi:hypothetical protein PCASD_23504 [Puccinia coronata f. sp. avenae]|uniref:Uncharacterized protein n=1 Tax=Puccinia coronata f. sp. avenae TaxID=200324 RepID=A0A2N5TK81_9BASI|nr:hypothetical protein PCASD_23504 [Puccinia coronata f. sp. avenae]